MSTPPNLPESPFADDPDVPLTPEHRQQIAAVLFPTTVDRFTVLLENLMGMTQMADYALWAPLAAIERQLQRLNFADGANDPEAAVAFLCLMSHVTREFSVIAAVHATGVADAMRTGQPIPKWPEWDVERSKALYARAQSDAVTLLKPPSLTE